MTTLFNIKKCKKINVTNFSIRRPSDTKTVQQSPLEGQQVDSEFARNGIKWDEKEDYILLREYYRNLHIDTIARKHQRSVHAIHTRLYKLIGLPNPYTHPNQNTPERKAEAQKRWHEWEELKASWAQKPEPQYVRGDWSASELTQLLSLGARNTPAVKIAAKLNRELDDVTSKMRQCGLID